MQYRFFYFTKLNHNHLTSCTNGFKIALNGANTGVGGENVARNTKDVIYLGAIEAFSELGFSATTMDTIAEKSGVVKRTLYYNFQTKEELFSYVMQRSAEELEKLLDGALSKHTDFKQKWHNVVDAHLSFYSKNSSVFHLIIQQIWKKDIHASFSIHHLFKNYFTRLDLEIENDKSNQNIAGDLDQFTCSASIFGMITIPVARAILNGQPIYTEKRVQTISNMILNSFGE